jgi:hypothetical protein
MIDYRTPPLGYLVRIPQESVDSPLDEAARARAEDAARFLSFENIGGVASCELPAALEMAEIVVTSIGHDIVHGLSWMEQPEVICGYLLNACPPFVLVLSDREIRAAVERLIGANVCGEIVAPGGIISVHRDEEKIVVRARHMVLDFTFTDFVDSVSSVSSVVENAGT